MWNRFSGKPHDSNYDLPSQSIRRDDDEQRPRAHRSDSIASSNSNKKSSSRADDRAPRGFNPTSTSYSSTTRGQYPGAASASIASSYATASGNNNCEPYVAPGLVRNASLADQMQRSKSSRSSRDQDEAREIKDKKRDKTDIFDGRDQDIERQRKRDKRDKKGRSLRRSENGLDEEVGSSRGPDDFPDQVASSGFSQFPGQNDGAIPGPNGAAPEHPAMSSHVQDQFPGQFPTQSSAPYRPPLAASEGGPGLAAEYYGDDGQSVAEQPGNRANTPSLIIGAEPHLQPALAVAAPPPEPSASGAVGAAASFFSGEFEEDEAASTHGQQNASTYVTSQIRPNSNHHSSSAPIIPTIGGTAIGSAAGYLIDSQTSTHQQRTDHKSSIGGAPSEYSAVTTQRPPSQTQASQYSSKSQPPTLGKQSSQSSNTPIYATGAAGATGLAAAAAYEHNHHSLDHNVSSAPQYSTTSMAQRHRNNGPFGALLDFFKDPEGVAQFEEYSQIIGVCRDCFAPGSSTRDAPRKHLYGRRQSNERYGSSTRVDKDSRYYSSDNEGRRKSNKSWQAAGLPGYGLAKLGESLFQEKNDYDDTYIVKNGRFSPDGRDRRARRRSRSKERFEIEITGDGKSDRKEPRNDTSTGTKRLTYSTGRQSGTRSRSRDRKTGLTEAAIGAAPETSAVASSSRRRSRSPKRTSVKGKHKGQEASPERRHKTKKKKKRDRSFFGFGNGSSSSSSVDLAYTGGQDKHRSIKRSNGKSKDDKKAEAALLGLGAAAAALALNDGRQGHRKNGVRELVGAKKTKGHDGHGSGQAHRPKKSYGNLDDELWESAAEDDYESIDSDLAYGAPVRRDSRASFSSESSGTNKWGWRWGSKKNRRASSPRRKSSDHSSFPPVASVTRSSLTGAAMTPQDQPQGSAMDSTSSLPLQHVYPVPTSDPSRFDVGREGSIVSSSRPVMSSRPEAVPLQHPRPIAPVSASIYSSQTAYDHSHSAPSGPAVFSQTPYHHHPGTSDDRHSTHEASIPGSFPRVEQPADDTARDFRIRRRDTSPGRFGEDSISSSMAPPRRTSVRDDSSAVRFDLTEEQEERDRRERRRKRKEDKERREAEEQEQVEKDRRFSRERSSRKLGSNTKPEEVLEKSFEKSWAGPAAAGVIGAAIGAAAATDRSRSEETREERRERRRKERELENEEDALSKSERRRRQRERDDQEAAIKERGNLPDENCASRGYVDHEERSPEKQDMSVWQEAASTKRSSVHENYGAFFTPLELLNKSSDQIKITSANADADIDMEQVPQIVTVEPKRIRDLSDSPAFSLVDTDDKIDPSKLSFPWQVPKLRLVEPTPPSTRGSTPIPRPKDAGDEGFEEPRKEPSSSKVKWGDDQTHEYTIIAPKEDHDESVEPSSGDMSVPDPVDLSSSTHERDLPDHEMHPRNDSTMESSSAIYGEDAAFAATLAASAEDAGFDPSIVINNPTYRRRDSPPGSNENSMPGGFDDENEPRLHKKDRKRKEKASRRQSQNDGPNGRDDDTIVQDIISQVEESEFQPPNQVLLEKLDDEWEKPKKTRSRKSKKSQKGSESRDDLFETSETTSKALDSESRDVYESPTEDVRSIESISNKAESGRKSRKKSKRNSTGFDDAASTVPSPSTNEASKDPNSQPKEKRKGSIWDRVLGKSPGSLPQENGAKDVTDQSILKDFGEPKMKSKKTEERKSSRDGDDNHDSKDRSSIGGTVPQVSGRISQDLPVKVYTPVPSGRAYSKELLNNSQDHGTSLPPLFSDAGSVAQYLDRSIKAEQVEEKQPESFLGMRPEPPPPPDTRAESEALSDLSETTSLPATPHAESETQSRRFSDAETSSPTQTTAALPSSPTAVPFHFRRPGRSSSTARSLSQTPFSSNESATDLTPKQKTRPRSTEFKSSKEIRPLWPVERHRLHQEPNPDETYPSLPSSHTTSRSSSVHNLEGSEHHQRGPSGLNEAEHEPIQSAPVTSTDSHPIQSDLLESQLATSPTASSFQDSRTVKDLLSPQASRDSSPKVSAEENPHESSSTLKSAVLGAVLGGPAAVALNEPIQNNAPIRQDLFREENEDFEHALDDMVLDTIAYPSYNNALGQGEDFVPQKTRKGKKNKRKAGQFQQETVQPSFGGAVEAKPSTNSIDVELLSAGTMRQIQEQDAQDAVDSWFPSVLLSSKGKKGKKGKSRGLAERSPEENGPFPDTYEPPRDNLKNTVPAGGQESDTLTRQMSREQIVDIMTAVAQDANKDEKKASQSATAVVQEPFETLAEENCSESKVKEDNKGQEDLPQDGLQTKTFSKDGFPQEDLPQDGLAQDNLPQSGLQQETLPKNEPPHSELPQLENNQETLPQGDFPLVNLPRDDFSHSQDPQRGSLLSSSVPDQITFTDPFLKQSHRNVLESPKANPASQEELDPGDSTKAISPLLELSPRATPLPNVDDDHDLLDERLEIPVSTSLDRSDDKEMEIAAGNPLDVPHIHDLSAVIPELQKQAQDLTSQAEQVDPGDYSAVPSKKKSKKGKKAKQSCSVEENEQTEIQKRDGPLPSVNTSTTLEEDWPKDSNDEPAMKVLQEKSETLDDGWERSTSKKKGKKGKVTKQSISVENSKATEIQRRQQSLPYMAASEAPEDHEARKLIDESAVDVSQPKTEPLEDEWTASNDNKKGKKVERQRSKTSSLGLSPDETEHQFERQPDARDDMNDRALSLATTRTSQEVGAMLGLDETEASIEGESKEAFPIESHAEHNLRKPSEDHISGSYEQKLPVSYEPETPHSKDAPGKAQDDGIFLNLHTPVAGTNAAQRVQDILVGENNAESATDAKREAMVASTSMEEKATDRPIKEDELVGDAPKKKKKSKKGKKNEKFSWDEPEIKPETTEPAEVSDPPGATNTPLEQEPTPDRPMEENELDRDAPKKRTKGKKGKKNEAFSWDEPETKPETTEPAEVSDPPGATNTPLEQEPAPDRPMEENELDRDAPKKRTKGNKGKKNEAFSWDEPETKPETTEPAGDPGPPGAMNTPLEQESAADRVIEVDELDRDTLKKKKKGKRGRKNEEYSLDEPDIMKPAEPSDLPAAMNPYSLEQEPAVKAIDEVFSKQSKKDKKNKRSRRNGVSRAVSDFRDGDEPNIIPIEVPQDDDKTEDLPPSASDFQEEIEPSIILTEVPQDDNKVEDLREITRDSRDEVEPSVVPTEVLQDDGQVEERSAVDRQLVTRDVREANEPNCVPIEALQDDDKMEDLPAVGMPRMRAEIGAPVEVVEPAVTTKSAQGNENEESREAPLEQEQDLMPPKGKKDREKTKNSKKSNALSPDDCEDPALGHGQIAEIKALETDEIEHMTPSSVKVVDEPEKTVQKTQLEQQEEDYTLPTNEKDEKKSKKFVAFSLDSDVSPTLEDEPVSKTENLEKESLKQTPPSSADTVKEPGKCVEGLPEETKDREETEEAQPFEWKNEDITAQPEQETAQELNKDSEIDSKVNPLNAWGDLVMVGGRGEEPMHGYFDSVSAHAAASDIPHKATSSVESSPEQPTVASEEITAYRANEMKSNIVSAAETDNDSLYSVKLSKKNEKRTKKALPLTWEEDGLSQEPTAVLTESSATEDLGEPSIIPVSQDSGSWSKPEISAEEIVPTEIVQPGMRSEEDQRYQGSVLEDPPSQARDDIHTMVEAEQEESFANGERTKTEKLSIYEPEEDRSAADDKELAWVTATSAVQGNEHPSKQQPRDDLSTAGEIRSKQEESAGGMKRDQTPILTESGMIEEAKDEELLWDVSVQRAEEPEKQDKDGQWGELIIGNLSSSAAQEAARETAKTVRNTESITDLEPLRGPNIDQPNPPGGVKRLDAQEQRDDNNEEYEKELERALPNREPVADLEPLGGPDIDKPIPAVEVAMLDAQEQRDYNEEYAKELERALPNTEPVADLEPLGGPDIDKPIPAVEVAMLDAQEQRNYNEEYAKELERQLSPSQEGERADPSRDEAHTPVFSQSSIDSVMERPYEEEHRPLARPPALEDIIEESRSRSASVHGSPVDQEDDYSPVKSTKKGKKGKKSKKSKKQQPIIWEDETATPPPEPESDQRAKPSIRSTEGPGSRDTDAARPLELEEPIDQRSLEDRTIASPTGYLDTADNNYLIENDGSDDYFNIQPSRPAEEDVGREDTHEFRRALSTGPPCSSRDRSPAREPQIDQDGHLRDDAVTAYDRDGKLRSLATDFHDKLRTEVEPAEEQVKDNYDPAPLKSTKKGKKASAREPSPQTLGQESLMDQPQDLETPTMDTLNERSTSQQHFLQSSSHEDELSSVAEGRPISRGRSGSRELVAAAVGLGVGALAAGSLSKRDSRKEWIPGEKAKEARRGTDFEAEIGEPENPLDRGGMDVEEQEHRQTSESERATRAWEHHQATSSTNYEAAASHPFVGDLGQSSETPKYRDSAIYISGSPIISEEIPYHRAVRDSGYPDTEASPVVGDELENPDDPTELESGVAAGEMVEHVQHRHSRAHETDQRQRSTSSNPSEKSVEANSDHDVSVSRPKERRKRSRRRSGTAYDSDDSADSGFDIQRRRRRQAMVAEPREPSPVSSTTKDRSSALFDPSPSAREETIAKPQDQAVSPRYNPVGEEPTWSFDREESPPQRSSEASREGRSGNIPALAPESTDHDISTGNEDTGMSLFGGPQSYEDDLPSLSRSPRSSESRGRRRLNTISEDSADGSPLHKKDKRAVSDVGSPESGVKGRRMRSPSVEDDVAGEYVSTHDPISRPPWPAADEEKRAVDERSRSRNSDQLSTLSSHHSALPGVTPRHREDEYRTASAASMRSESSIHAIIRTPDQVRSASGLSYRSSGTPPLRRVDRSASGDLRGASKKSEAKYRAKSSAELEAELDIGIPSSSTYDPVTDKGKSRADMADVYEGWGDVRGQSPMSPTRPPSMRKRQSMQLLDLETRLDQIVSENRLLASQKLTVEKALQEQARDHSQERHAYEEGMQEQKIYLTRKDSELSELKQIIEQLHNQAAHLTEVNEGLASSRGVDEEHEQRYNQLRAEHAHTHEQWQQSTKELGDLKEQHTQLSTGMEDIVRHEVTVALEEKNLELRQLQSELENAKQQVRNLQQQLLASRNSDDFVERDEDYFDSQCQSLCQHVQQWVLRFSKFSDMKACYLASEVRDEKVVDRMENAILDGSDVDDYLSDRVKRRDVFMSVVMTMVWEFIFTRYLFGMDREQRQKLKNLEKTLQEVGPISAVHKWRATTLTLLMKREAFENQRATDTEAVVHEIYDTLATFLPPPSHLVGQIQDSLRKVIDTAADLSIEMRTQRAEYSMLPPLQPEYDTNGDLARKVYFSALTMNERSGATSSNEALQEQHAVVRMVLFPLVVKNEDDDEQIVVCPAQVLTAEGSKGKKTVRVMSAQGGRSEASFAGSDVRMEGGMI